jgi:hypothetical protein
MNRWSNRWSNPWSKWSTGLLVAGASMVAACSGGGDGATATGAKPGDFAAHSGLCAALDAAAAGDERSADVIFFNRSHDQLHDLARRVGDVDRAAAARLLETKSTVERALNVGDDGLAGDLSRLAAATAAAIGAVGDDPPTACE